MTDELESSPTQGLGIRKKAGVENVPFPLLGELDSARGLRSKCRPSYAVPTASISDRQCLFATARHFGRVQTAGRTTRVNIQLRGKHKIRTDVPHFYILRHFLTEQRPMTTLPFFEVADNSRSCHGLRSDFRKPLGQSSRWRPVHQQESPIARDEEIPEAEEGRKEESKSFWKSHCSLL